MSREIADNTEFRVVEKCCVEEIRYRGKSTRMFNGKAKEYMLLSMGKRKIYK